MTRKLGFDREMNKLKVEFEQRAEFEKRALQETERKMKRLQQEQKMSEKEEVELTDKLRKEGEQKVRTRQAKEALKEKLKNWRKSFGWRTNDEQSGSGTPLQTALIQTMNLSFNKQ